MAKVIRNYFNLILIILIGINIINVIASDCDIFTNIVSYIDDKSYKQQYEKSENCCSFKDITCDYNQNIIGM